MKNPKKKLKYNKPNTYPTYEFPPAMAYGGGVPPEGGTQYIQYDEEGNPITANQMYSNKSNINIPGATTTTNWSQQDENNKLSELSELKKQREALAYNLKNAQNEVGKNKIQDELNKINDKINHWETYGVEAKPEGMYYVSNNEGMRYSESVKNEGMHYSEVDNNSFDDMSFNSAFGAARKQGLKKFTWKGKSYGTNLAKSNSSGTKMAPPVVSEIKGYPKKAFGGRISYADGGQNLAGNLGQQGYQNNQVKADNIYLTSGEAGLAAFAENMPIVGGMVKAQNNKLGAREQIDRKGGMGAGAGQAFSQAVDIALSAIGGPKLSGGKSTDSSYAPKDVTKQLNTSPTQNLAWETNNNGGLGMPQNNTLIDPNTTDPNSYVTPELNPMFAAGGLLDSGHSSTKHGTYNAANRIMSRKYADKYNYSDLSNLTETPKMGGYNYGSGGILDSGRTSSNHGEYNAHNRLLSRKYSDKYNYSDLSKLTEAPKYGGYNYAIGGEIEGRTPQYTQTAAGRLPYNPYMSKNINPTVAEGAGYLSPIGSSSLGNITERNPYQRSTNGAYYSDKNININNYKALGGWIPPKDEYDNYIRQFPKDDLGYPQPSYEDLQTWDTKDNPVFLDPNETSNPNNINIWNPRDNSIVSKAASNWAGREMSNKNKMSVENYINPGKSNFDDGQNREGSFTKNKTLLSKAMGGQLTEVNTGGTHEQNALGGVPVGKSASVEQNESMSIGKDGKPDFVFPDRIKLDKDTASKFDLSGVGKSFDKLARAASRVSDLRTDDKLDKELVESRLAVLKEALEYQKAKEAQKHMAKAMDLAPEMFQQAQPQGMPQEQMAMQDPAMEQMMAMQGQGMPQGMPQQPMMASGGSLNFKSSGAYNKWLGYVHANKLAENTPGHQKVSIGGEPHRVQHGYGGVMQYPLGGPFDFSKAIKSAEMLYNMRPENNMSDQEVILPDDYRDPYLPVQGNLKEYPNTIVTLDTNISPNIPDIKRNVYGKIRGFEGAPPMVGNGNNTQPKELQDILLADTKIPRDRTGLKAGILAGQAALEAGRIASTSPTVPFRNVNLTTVNPYIQEAIMTANKNNDIANYKDTIRNSGASQAQFLGNATQAYPAMSGDYASRIAGMRNQLEAANNQIMNSQEQMNQQIQAQNIEREAQGRANISNQLGNVGAGLVQNTLPLITEREKREMELATMGLMNTPQYKYIMDEKTGRLKKFFHPTDPGLQNTTANIQTDAEGNKYIFNTTTETWNKIGAYGGKIGKKGFGGRMKNC